MVTPSGGELQVLPTARRVICESREATLLSLNGSSGDGWGAEGSNRPAKCGRAASGTPLGIAFSWDTLTRGRATGLPPRPPRAADAVARRPTGRQLPFRKRSHGPSCPAIAYPAGQRATPAWPWRKAPAMRCASHLSVSYGLDSDICEQSSVRGIAQTCPDSNLRGSNENESSKVRL